MLKMCGNGSHLFVRNSQFVEKADRIYEDIGNIGALFKFDVNIQNTQCGSYVIKEWKNKI